MHPTIKKVAVNLSELVPVKWDRYTEFNGHYNIYGWIARSDNQRDFVLLQLYMVGESIKGGFVTSSAKFTKKIDEYIFGEFSQHVDCIKFETDALPTDSEGEE